MHKLLLFIPCYNCEKQIGRVLSQLKMIPVGLIAQAIVVDNGSNDKTLEVAKDFISANSDLPIKLFKNTDNYNLGGSHKVAFKYAIENNFDYVIVLHGDDQADLADLKQILINTVYEKYDCVLGARFHPKSKLTGYSKFRIFGNIVFNIIFSVFLNKKLFDLGSGLNMYSVKMLRDEFYLKFPDELTFNYCMIIASSFYRHNLMFFPISWREEDQVSNVKIVSQAFSTLSLLFKYVFLRDKFLFSDLRKNNVNNYTFVDISPIVYNI